MYVQSISERSGLNLKTSLSLWKLFSDISLVLDAITHPKRIGLILLTTYYNLCKILEIEVLSGQSHDLFPVDILNGFDVVIIVPVIQS